VYLEHPNIKSDVIELREYQVKIAESAVSSSTLVVLATALGKTVIAALVTAKRYRPGKKVLFLAPTKPLVEQHARELARFLTIEKICLMTGEVHADKRVPLWSENDVIISTPQAILNDLTLEKLSLRDVNLIVFDEAHRAVGDYAYVDIASIYRATVPKEDRLVLAITASPGNSAEKIREICQNLGIERIDVRAESDPDVAPYIPGIQAEWITVELPNETREVISLLQEIYTERLDALRAAGLVPPKKYVRVREIMEVQTKIQDMLKERKDDSTLYECLVDQAVAMKVDRAIELAETQGRNALLAYFDRLIADGSSTKGNRELISDQRFKRALELTEAISLEHPKVQKVIEIVKSQFAKSPQSRIILFTHYRDTCEYLIGRMAEEPGIRPAKFIGQAARDGSTGMRQREQVATIVKFSRGELNLLIATSVGEEGLDIPATDMVIFYEPVPSEIRFIQRRGRTGRKTMGEVKVLLAKGTRDEWYLYASRAKERKMKQALWEVKRSLTDSIDVRFPNERTYAPRSVPKGAPFPASARTETLAPKRPGLATLESFSSDKARIGVMVDHREFNSSVVRELHKSGIKITAETLDAGDYIVSDRVAIERKSADDFHSSIIDGRIFAQAKQLCNLYPVPIMIVEGDAFAIGRMRDVAVAGAMVSLLADFRIPVMITSSPEETARLILALAKGEQTIGKKPVLRFGKGKWTNSQWQRFVVEGLPLISAVIAERLLKRFKSVRAIANATKEELMEVEGIGEKRAEEIVGIMNAGFEDEEKGKKRTEDRKGDNKP
jgi:Fanconi anemia group M protein